MRIGVIFPQFEFGTDPAAIRDYAQLAEELGYTHIGADDHIIGPNPNRPGGWSGWVTYQTPFYEPFVLFSFMAAVTQRVEFETCVLLLPQRQTVLVAKQAAGLDTLSNGRVRLGVGNGWNQIEYTAMNANMHDRGKRIEEQIFVLRQLWCNPLVSVYGQWHTVPDAGINPLPVQRPIPIWFGGQSEPVIKRAACIGDGWMPLYKTPEEAQQGLNLLDFYLDKVGRTRENFGFEGRLRYNQADADGWQRLVDGWQALGSTHLSLLTTDCGFSTPQEHMQALRRFAEVIQPAERVGTAAGG